MTSYSLSEAVAEWLKIREKELPNKPVSHIDAQHSALLQRLLSGKAALPTPPPKAYGYPAYDLYDEPYVEFSGETPFIKEDKIHIVIRQSEWKIVETLSDDVLVVTHNRTPGRFWRLERSTKKIPLGLDDYQIYDIWRMYREGPTDVGVFI